MWERDWGRILRSRGWGSRPPNFFSVPRNSTKRIPSSWENHEPKNLQQCSYCRMRTGHNTRNCPEKNSAFVSQPTGSQLPTLSSAYSPAPLQPGPLYRRPSQRLPAMVMQLVSEKHATSVVVISLQATPVSVPKSVLGPPINIGGAGGAMIMGR